MLGTSAAGALALELLELRSYGCDIAIEHGFVMRTQAQVSAIRRDGRFAIADQPSQSTLFAQVGCVQDALRARRDSPTLNRIVSTLDVARAFGQRAWLHGRSVRRSTPRPARAPAPSRRRAGQVQAPPPRTRATCHRRRARARCGTGRSGSHPGGRGGRSQRSGGGVVAVVRTTRRYRPKKAESTGIARALSSR